MPGLRVVGASCSIMEAGKSRHLAGEVTWANFHLGRLVVCVGNWWKLSSQCQPKLLWVSEYIALLAG